MSAVPSVFHLAKAPRKVKNQTNTIDPDFLKVEHSTKVEAKRMPVGKYDELFSQLKYGSCVVCESDEVDRIASALRKWLNRHGKHGVAKRNTRCRDGKARIWMLDK